MFMSTETAQTFPVVHYIRVVNLFQEVQRETPPLLPATVHIQPIPLKIAGWQVWGILITALPADTIHAAWVVVESAREVMLSPARAEQVQAKQNRLYIRLVAYAEQLQFTVRPNVHVVPDGVFRFSATLPADLPPRRSEREEPL